MYDYRQSNPRIKLKWAIARIGDLDKAIGEFLTRTPPPYEVLYDPGAQTQEQLPRIKLIEDIPDSIFCLTGDILHNLRASLDHLLYRMVPPGAWERNYGFPIGKGAAKYPKTASRKIPDGLRPDLRNRIDRIEPYKGGKGHALWCLDELNAIDKHRLLVTIVFAQHITRHGHAIGATLRPSIGAIGRWDGMIPVQNGATLLPTENRIRARDEVIREPRILIALNEPQIVEPEALVPQLMQFADSVEGVIAIFDDV